MYINSCGGRELLWLLYQVCKDTWHTNISLILKKNKIYKNTNFKSVCIYILISLSLSRHIGEKRCLDFLIYEQFTVHCLVPV